MGATFVGDVFVLHLLRRRHLLALSDIFGGFSFFRSYPVGMF